MSTVAKGADYNIVKDLGAKYNRLVDEKFMLIEQLCFDTLHDGQRIALRNQITALHYNILRTDNLRNAIAFGWKYEPVTDIPFASLKQLTAATSVKYEDEIITLKRRLHQVHEHLEIAQAKLHAKNWQLWGVKRERNNASKKRSRDKKKLLKTI